MKVFWLLLLLCLSACAGKSVETGFHEFKFDENGDAISFVYSDDDKGIVMSWQKIDEGVYKSVRRSLDGVITEWKYESDNCTLSFDEDGKLVRVSYTLDGKTYTTSCSYTEDVLTYESSYVDDKKHGVTKLYENDGTLAMEWMYVNGKLDGIHKKYFDNFLKVSIYKKDKLIGGYCLTKDNEMVPLSPEEILGHGYILKCRGASEKTPSEDEEIVLYHKDGTVSVGIRENYVSSFNKQGKPTYLAYFIDGIAYAMVNGIYSESSFIDGKAHGIGKYYNLDESLSFEENSVNGELDGIQKYYSDGFRVISIYETGDLKGGYCLTTDTNALIPLSIDDILTGTYGECY